MLDYHDLPEQDPEERPVFTQPAASQEEASAILEGIVNLIQLYKSGLAGRVAAEMSEEGQFRVAIYAKGRNQP